MLIFVGVIALVACGIALVLLPLRLPWSQRVRWIVAAHAMGGWGMSAEPTIMREVFVVDLYDTTPARVVVRTAGVAAVDTTLVLPAAPRLSIIAQLARWRAAGTPLLLVSDGSAS